MGLWTRRAGLAAVGGVVGRRSVFGYGGALALLLVLVLAPGMARASGTLDQSQTDFSGGGGGIAGPDNTFNGPESSAQTFTAGLTGGVDRVDLFLGGTTVLPTAPVTVEIRDTSSGTPGSTVLASASVPSASVSPYGSWVEVDFSSPAPVTSGTQYAIVAYTGDNGTFPYYVWAGGLGDPYSGGASWDSTSSPPTTWTEYPNFELAFKTYVTPSASAQAALLVETAPGSVPERPCSRRRARSRQPSAPGRQRVRARTSPTTWAWSRHRRERS